MRERSCILHTRYQGGAIDNADGHTRQLPMLCGMTSESLRVALVIIIICVFVICNHFQLTDSASGTQNLVNQFRDVVDMFNIMVLNLEL